jgi:hypothetical protein
MAEPRRSQKQIAAQYQGNLDYYKRFHFGRRARFLVTLLALAIGVAAVIVYQKKGNEKFFNPGPLSRNHVALAERCESCHDKSLLNSIALIPVEFRDAAAERFRTGVAFAPIDSNCAVCHLKRDHRVYNFHEPNVVAERSCSVCHMEHQGPEPMAAVPSAQCATCHNNPATMAVSTAKGRGLDLTNFQRHPHLPQQVVFDLPRPPQGFTRTFAAFWDGHPEFQLKRESVHDPDVLRFNHQRHFAPDIPAINGQKLDCFYCHKPDSEGRFIRPIRFAAHCQACHSLQFDPKNPELTLPHGDTVAVRGFLHDLPTRYAELAVRKGISKPNEIKSFVTQQMLRLQARVLSGENFEQQVFFVADPYKHIPGTDARVRASFYGCALCHGVQPVANAAPYIAKPVFVDRWIVRSPFNHASHAMVECDDCHHATQSRLTSDVLMPGINACNTCHSPKGKVLANNQKIIAAAECSTCHKYHVPQSLTMVQPFVR